MQAVVVPQVDLAVPSGNLGNMVSALLAREMGLPYGNMIVAANSNNVRGSKIQQEEQEEEQ